MIIDLLEHATIQPVVLCRQFTRREKAITNGPIMRKNMQKTISTELTACLIRRQKYSGIQFAEMASSKKARNAIAAKKFVRAAILADDQHQWNAQAVNAAIWKRVN